MAGTKRGKIGERKYDAEGRGASINQTNWMESRQTKKEGLGERGRILY